MLLSRFSRTARLLLLSLFASVTSHAADWQVVLDIHKVKALTATDTWAGQDMYRKIWIEPLVGTGTAAFCENEDNIDLNEDNVTPGDWGCSMKIVGGLNAKVRIKVEIWDDDIDDFDDELDINPSSTQLGLDMEYEPGTKKLTILSVPGFTTGACAPGKITKSGFGPGSGSELAEITFSVSSSDTLAPDGDSDGDGLLDTWETCGVNHDGDSDIEIDLKAMGADPFRKDVFVEVDWMIDTAHSHAPWLPALVQAWAEMDQAPVSNPPNDAGVPSRGGIALHVDVGNLFANYVLDVDGALGNEFAVDGSGNIDLVMDPLNTKVGFASGVPDIGNLRAVGGGSLAPGVLGGNPLTELTTLLPRPGSAPMTGFFRPGSSFHTTKHSPGPGWGNFDPARDDVFHYAIFGHTFLGAGTVVGLTEGSISATTPVNDFMVTPSPLVTGTFGVERKDTDRDGLSDAAGVEILNPMGLRVHGAFSDHKSIFLHELGHNFTLPHGAFNLDGHPNYASVMSVAFFGGVPYVAPDGIGNRAMVDYDGDGILDIRRFHYSHKQLPTLNEAALDESVPVDPSPTQMVTNWTCPPGGGLLPPFRFRRMGLPQDWDCDGVFGETGAAVGTNNINNFFGTSPPNQILLGYWDYSRLINGGLDFPPDPDQPSSDIDQVRQIKANSQRITEPPHREWFQARCPRPRHINFEEFARGTRIDTEYQPAVTFLADALRAPEIIGPSERNNVPTASTAQSLMNRPRADVPTPLSMTFGIPQRVVRLHIGQGGLTNAPRDRVRAVLRAWDQHDLPMGVLVRPMPPPATGVTEQLTAVAIFPDELISRIELSFETSVTTGAASTPVPISEPMLIDDLSVCEKLDETGVQPVIFPQPKFGDRKVGLTIASEAVHETGTFDVSGKSLTVRALFTGLPITINGSSGNKTDAQVTRPEGTSLNIGAPATWSGWKFLYWQHSSGVSFGNGTTTIPLTLLKDGTLTAVYEGRRTTPARPPEDDRGYEDCVRECLRPHKPVFPLPEIAPQKESNKETKEAAR